MLAGGCQARTSAEAAQTAVAVAQTALPSLPSFTDQVRPLLPGVAIDVRTTPADAPNEAVSEVTISGADGAGALAQVDPRAREAAASAAMGLASRYYPNARIVLDIRDRQGAPLVQASRAPGDTQ